MVTIPTVQSFLGFVDLRIACIAIAMFRMFVSIIILILLFVVFAVVEHKVDKVSQFVVSTDAKEEISRIEFFVAVFVIVAAVVLAINLLATYWFIKGANSVRRWLYNKFTKEKIKFQFHTEQSNQHEVLLNGRSCTDYYVCAYGFLPCSIFRTGSDRMLHSVIVIFAISRIFNELFARKCSVLNRKHNH